MPQILDRAADRAAFSTVRAPSTRSYGQPVTEALRGAGVELLSWQADWFDELLEVDELGHLTRTTATLIVPRRNGKTFAIAARALAGIVFLGELRVLYTAHNGDTANEVFGMMRELCQLPAVEPLVKRVYESNGKERIEFHDGGRFQVRTRTEHGGRGRETDLLILDEALQLSESSVAALVPLTAKAAARGRGQVIYASSAGTDSSDVLLGLRDAGRELDGKPGGSISYREFTADRGDDPADPGTWAKANPSLGSSILSPGYLESALATMPLESFRREHLGLWANSGDLPAIDPDAWAALASSTAVEVDPSSIVLGFDVSLDRTVARILAVARAVDGRSVVRVLASWHELAGIDAQQLELKLEQLYDELGPSWIAFDKLGAGDIAGRLDARGFPVKAFAATQTANAALVLEHDVTAGKLIHDGHEALADDLGRMTPKPFGDGAWLPTRKAVTAGPITGGVALIAAYAALQLVAEADSTVVAARR